MHPCPHCGCHVQQRDRDCPHCGTVISTAKPSATAAAMLLGLTLSACPPISPQPKYGVSTTDYVTDTDTDADTDTDTDADADTSGDTGP